MRAAGLALLALAAVWPRWRSARALLACGAAALLVAAVWPASFRGRDNDWAVGVAVVAVLLLWWAVPTVCAAVPRYGAPWWALLGSAAAVYGCVPETDQMREVAVVVLAGLLTALALRRPLPTPAVLAAAGFVEWSALDGATGQARALAGGLFALTPLVAMAVVARTEAAPRAVWAVGGVWAVAAAAMARTGGIATSLPPAVSAALLCAAVATAVSAALCFLSRR